MVVAMQQPQISDLGAQRAAWLDNNLGTDGAWNMKAVVENHDFLIKKIKLPLPLGVGVTTETNFEKIKCVRTEIH